MTLNNVKTVPSHSQKKAILDGFLGKFIQPTLNITNNYFISVKGKLSGYDKLMFILTVLSFIFSFLSFCKSYF